MTNIEERSQEISNLSKWRGAIYGACIGDALGVPLETLTAKEISTLYPNFSYEECAYVEPAQGRRLADGVKAGEFSDDGDLTLATVEALTYKGYISPFYIAECYASFFRHEKLRGWGRSTIASVSNLVDGAFWMEASEDSMGTGNGAAMKAAPLGLVLTKYENDSPEFFHCCNSIIDVCKITHKEPGIRGGFLQALLVYFSVKGDDPITILWWLQEYEIKFFGDAIFTEKMTAILKRKNISTAQIAKRGGLTSRAEESWVTSAAVFLNLLSENLNPIETMFKLISLGGDADSCGSMLGALIGSRYGLKIFPNELIENLQENNIKELSLKFYKAFQSP